MSGLPLRKLVMVPDRIDLRSSDGQFLTVPSAVPGLTRAPKPIHEPLMTQPQLAVVEPNELKTFEADEPKKKTKNKWVSLAIRGWVALLRITRSSSARPGGKPVAARKRSKSSPIVFISPGGFAIILPASETFLTLTQLDRDKARYHNSAQQGVSLFAVDAARMRQTEPVLSAGRWWRYQSGSGFVLVSTAIDTNHLRLTLLAQS